MTVIRTSQFPTRLKAGCYTATTTCSIALFSGARKIEYTLYDVGESIEIPATVNGFWYGLEANGDLYHGYTESSIVRMQLAGVILR